MTTALKQSPSLAPARLAEGGGTDYERQLLASARLDAVPVASEERVHAALRASASGGAPLRGEGNGGAAASAVRPWAIGIVGAGVVGALVASYWPQPSEPMSERAPQSIAAGNVADRSMAAGEIAESGVPTTTPDPVSVVAPPPDGAQTEKPSAAKAPAPKANRTRPKTLEARGTTPALTPAPRAQSTGASLAAEVRSIERIQTLLGWGQSEDASRALAGYRREFPRGELVLEADLLEVDVALARGERDTARRLARTLLERPEASRYRARLGELLEAADGSNPPAR